MEDRISLFLDGSQGVLDAVAAHDGLIAREVLAVDLAKGRAPDAGYTTAQVSVAGESCAIAMKVV